MEYIRDQRLMIFTSLLKVYNAVSHARVTQCHKWFVEFEEKFPLTEPFATRTGRSVDHRNMKEFIKSKKLGGLKND